MNNSSKEEEYEVNYSSAFLARFLFVAGMLLGGLIGAAAMLLLAPQLGKETRKQIRRKSRDLRNQTSDALEDGVDLVREKAQQVTLDSRFNHAPSAQ